MLHDISNEMTNQNNDYLPGNATSQVLTRCYKSVQVNFNEYYLYIQNILFKDRIILAS